MKRRMVSADELIDKLLDVASDYEADCLDDLLVRAGVWWECAVCGYHYVGEPCHCKAAL